MEAPIKGEIWESISKEIDEDDGAGSYYFVKIVSNSKTNGIFEVNYCPLDRKTGSVYRMLVTKKLSKFVKIYKKKTGASYWVGRKMRLPDFVTLSPRTFASINEQLKFEASDEFSPESIDGGKFEVEEVSELLAMHFERKRSEYDALKRMLVELSDDLRLYDEYKHIL